MQEKRGASRLGAFLLALTVMIVIGCAVLMTRDIPAPQIKVEKSLDAKAFLAGKP